jgi:hypothetical protein
MRVNMRRPACMEHKRRSSCVSSTGADGWDRIRTCDWLSPKHAFQACALNHSATHPKALNLLTLAPVGHPLKMLLLDFVIEQQQRPPAHDRLLLDAHGDYLE